MDPGRLEASAESEAPAPQAQQVISAAPETAAAHVLALQRTAGNRAVVRLLQRARDEETNEQVFKRKFPATPGEPGYAWSDPQLGDLVDKGSSSGPIQAYVNKLDVGARTLAIQQLKDARADYRRRRVHRDRIQYIDEVLQHAYRVEAQGVAVPWMRAPEGGWKAGKAPKELTAGTHTPTQAERERLRDSLTPVHGTGAGGNFKSQIPGNPLDYETRIELALWRATDKLLKGLVEGKREEDRKDQTKLIDWPRYEEIADVAKQMTDTVFGAWATGPAFRHGDEKHPGNLHDRWVEEKADQEKWDKLQHKPRATMRHAAAADLVAYFLQSATDVAMINQQHGAVPDRTTVSPGETESEADILARVTDRLADERTQDLLDINRGWEGVASGGTVWLQRWAAPTPDAQRFDYWSVLQTLIHEYLHTLTHPRYYQFAQAQPGGGRGLAYNTLVEGMTSALTEVVWEYVAGQIIDASVAKRVEGPVYVDEEHTKAAFPVPYRSRYNSLNEAMEIISTVGLRNACAAYFLGQTDLVAPAPEKTPAATGGATKP